MLIACKNHNVINREIYSLFLAQSSAIEGVVSKSANESPNLPQLLLKNLIINLGKTTRYAPNASDMLVKGSLPAPLENSTAPLSRGARINPGWASDFLSHSDSGSPYLNLSKED